jgi:hypothetical protein
VIPGVRLRHDRSLEALWSQSVDTSLFRIHPNDEVFHDKSSRAGHRRSFALTTRIICKISPTIGIETPLSRAGPTRPRPLRSHTLRRSRSESKFRRGSLGTSRKYVHTTLIVDQPSWVRARNGRLRPKSARRSRSSCASQVLERDCARVSRRAK